MANVPRRPPQPRPLVDRLPLTRDRIVDRALLLAREEGMAGVSMRRLGRELGVEPMSLYHHVPSRAVLMVLMASRSVANLPDLDPEQLWYERLIELLMHTYRAGVDDPAVFPVLASESLGSAMLPALEPESGAASLGLIQRLAALLAEGDVAENRRLAAGRGLIGLVVGFIVGQVDGLSSTIGAADDPPTQELRPPGSGADPVLSAMHSDDPADDLRFSLEMFVRGLRAAGR